MRLKISMLAATLLATGMLAATPASAQMKPLSDPVIAHPDPVSLFNSPDPKVHKNKQAALHIMKELLQCNQWTRAPEWITDRYIQHNPFAASGLKGVMDYFINVAKRPEDKECKTLTSPIVAVQAEGDYVTVLTVRTLPMPGDPTKSYTTTWFDTWRFVDGKADQHWDPASLPEGSPPAVGSVDAELRRAKDREEIEALMWRYDRALDKFNADAYASAFTEDGSFGETKGREALRKMVADFTKDGKAAPKLQHATSNQWIEFTGPNTAKIHYYWQTYRLSETGKLEDPPKLLAAGNGVDEVVRVNGKWLFHSRSVVAPND